jgi:hypothetical protein
VFHFDLEIGKLNTTVKAHHLTELGGVAEIYTALFSGFTRSLHVLFPPYANDVTNTSMAYRVSRYWLMLWHPQDQFLPLSVLAFDIRAAETREKYLSVAMGGMFERR